MITQGSILQIVFGLLVSFGYVMMLAKIKPYEQHGSLAIFAGVALTLIFLCSLLVKIADEFEQTSYYEQGFSATTLTVMLVLLTLSVFLFGLLGVRVS